MGHDPTFDARLAGIVRDFEKRATRLLRNSDQPASSDEWFVKLEVLNGGQASLSVGGRANSREELLRLIEMINSLQPFLLSDEADSSK